MAGLNNFTCCIHVGFPKTATTTLQFALFSNHSQISYLGKPYYNEEAGYDASKAVADLVADIWQKDSLAYDPARMKLLFDKGVTARIRPEKIIVLSEEALTQASAADRALIAQRLHDVFGKCKILMTIRNQIDCLKSGYLWCRTRCIIDSSFDKWIMQCFQKSPYRQVSDDWPLRQFRYSEMLHLFEKIFGREKILILLYEDLICKSEQFAKQLSEFLGIDNSEVSDLLRGQCHNPSLSRFGLEYQRTIKKIKLSKARWSGDAIATHSEGIETGDFHNLVMKFLSHFEKQNITISPKIKTMLFNYFREDNRLLQNRWEIPVDQYEYPL